MRADYSRRERLKKADEPPSVSEIVPCRRNEVSAIASADAPIVYCDWIGPTGSSQNVVAITLEAIRLMTVGGEVVHDRVVVGHLRMPLQTARVLRKALEEMELLGKTPASSEKN
jgi:hypothetical protein